MRAYARFTPVTQPPDLGVLAAVLARQSADLSLYAEFVTSLLADALPEEYVRVVRKRGIFGTKPGAPVLMVSVRLGNYGYVLRRSDASAAPVAEIVHTVNGIVLSTRTVNVADWAQDVAGGLRALTETNADAAAALARITGYSL